MKCWTRVACLGIGLAVWLTWTAGAARAQVPAYQKPAVSPYINILRGGSSPAINYYGLVRPEITFGNSLYQLGVQQNALQGQQNNQQTALAAFTTLPATGHTSGFQTQSKYFMTNGGQGLGNNFAPGGLGAKAK